MTSIRVPGYGARLAWAIVAIVVATGFSGGHVRTLLAQTQDPCGSPINPIRCENSKPGNPASEWDVSGAGSASIQGFATEISAVPGETVRFKVDTTASAFRIDIYRLGYYGGQGARRIDTIPATATVPRSQPNCLTDSSTGLIDCGNWSQSASWVVPADATSGVYIAKLVSTAGPSGSSHIVFVVRDDEGHSDILFQTSDTTWQAYNQYGGNSLYVGSPADRAYEVSYNRPFTTRGTSPEDWVFNAESPMIRWLEANGYNVSYSTGIDTDRRGNELLEHNVFMSVGHDEYWSGDQRANVESARAAGVHLAFFSGNEVFWKTRWDSSIDGSGTPYRTLVTYKETHANSKIDPTSVWTGTWRDPRFSPPYDGGRPENALTGTIFTVNCCTYTITVPEVYGKARFWRNTTVATLAPGQTATLAANTLGYEWDEDLDNGFRPGGLMQLSSTTVSGVDYIQDYGSSYSSGTATHSLTLYRHSSGALVFGAGTVQWSWGLDGNHDRGASTPDVRMRQATVNLLADMGVQPSTIQSGLGLATASSDTIPPVTTITAPISGATVAAGAVVAVSGSASDPGGIVTTVEVSTDGGATWKRANGRGSWTFSFPTTTPGPLTIKSRGVDDSGNVEIPGAGVTITVTGPSGPVGLVAAYAFDEASGATTIDSSGRGNNGTHTNATRAAGRNGGGLTFNGSNAWVTVPDAPSLDLTTAMTIEAWVRPTTLSNWRTVLMKETPGGLSYTLYAYNGSRPAVWVNTGSDFEATSSVALAVNTWTHLAATYDGASLRFYLNGALVATRAVTGALRASSNPLRIGGNQPWGEYFAGTIDDVRVYASVLTAAQIVSDMNTPVGGTPPPDTFPPQVLSVSPVSSATNVITSAIVSATFDEPLAASSITTSTFELRDPANQLVPSTVAYDAATQSATLDPTGVLAPGTTYTATVKGGGTDPRVKDVAGNALAADMTWSFSTIPVPANEGPGGPILIIGSVANPFGRYYGEILRTEGLNLFTVTDISLVTATTLNAYDVVVLGEMPLSAAQVSMFTDWVTAGGNLIAMRPDKQLAGLLGITDAGTMLADRYLLIGGTGPGAGLVNQTIQYHSTADRYTLGSATAVATLYSSATTATANPAVTLRSVGANGGQAAAFTYDLARSVIYTRQGNPAWSGQERDGQIPIRSDDLFFGNATGDPQLDWIDFSRIAIPQADEQQRLLANLILHMNADRKPLPRLWYLPRGLKAAVVMTGDDHAGGGTAGRFNSYTSASTPGCVVANWDCIRGTSYLYPNSPLTNTQAASFNTNGFEVALHLSTNCLDYTPESIEELLSDQLATWSAKYTSIPAPRTNRTHCITWSDYTSQAKVELAHGIRLDTNYYYWPGTWILDRPGLFTGSAMPMRFADADGTMIDVYQATTQMTDESNQTYPLHINALLDRALGADGYYGVFTANMHTDSNPHADSDAIVASAKARGVPVVTARQMLTWLDGRNGSAFSGLAWNGGTLTFTLTQGSGAFSLQVLLPSQSPVGPLTSITRGGTAVPFTTQTIKGISYATFIAQAGVHSAVYTNVPPPDTGITSSPSNPTTSTSASFGFTSTPAGATFECSLDASAFAPCESPQGYTGLALGSHTFQVRAVNLGGPDLSPATFTWTINPSGPPDTSITSSPPASTTSTSASFTFTSTPAGGTFECALDGAPFVACTSPSSYTSLSVATHTFQVRAINAGGTDQTPASFTWTVTTQPPGPSCPCSIWSASTVPSVVDDGDPASVEIGTKFRSDVSGNVTGARFYKSTLNTGTHVAHLWSSTGTLLATATFTGETASGWQQVAFPSPVAISANTTYVISYFAPNGHYSAPDNYFLSAGVDNAPLHALRDGVDGPNGVYAYTTTGAFPTQTYLSESYFIDVVFNAGTTYSISGTITPAASGSGATVTLSGGAAGTTTADANGNYTFIALANGSYTVAPSKTGFTFTPMNQAVMINGANTTANFTAQPIPTFSISGTITPAASGSGATVTLSGGPGGTTTADASGNYTFSGLANGDYTVTPGKSGFTFTPASQAVTISGANAAANFTAQAVPTFSISGAITPAASGSGATVSLSGGPGGTTTADGNGNYTFSGLANGNYTLTPSKSGFTFTPVNQAVMINGANATANFTAQAVPTFSISGTITPPANGSGATVTLSGGPGGTTTADGSGNYTFTGLSNGNYTVTPSKSGFTFTPVNQAVMINGANATANFTALAGISIDATVTFGRSNASTTITSPAFSTTAPNELFLAFVATDRTSGTASVSSVTGASLTWQLVRQTNTQLGTAEIWRAFSTTTRTNVTVTATLNQSVAAAITVMTFSGVDTTGTNGSGAIGATGSGNANPGAPTATLVTTRAGSLVVGVGNDWDNGIARTLGPNQTLVSQYIATVGDTFWVQRTTTSVAASGTSVTINDTAPTTDRYNLTICEIRAVP